MIGKSTSKKDKIPATVLAFAKWHLSICDYTHEHERTVRWGAKRFEKWHGGPFPVTDLSEKMLSKWAAHIATEGRSRHTVQNALIVMRTIWSQAGAFGLCDPPGNRSWAGKSERRIVKRVEDSLTRKVLSRLQSNPLVDDVLVEYFKHNLRIQSQETRRQYQYAIGNLADFLRRDPRLNDLTDDNVTGMMRLLLERGLSHRTVNDRRDRINAMWRWCAKRALVKQFPTNGPLAVGAKTPTGWLPEELRRLFASFVLQQGDYEGITASTWWTTLHIVAYETAERVGALLLTKWIHLRGNHLHLPAEIRKAGLKDAVYQLSPPTVATLEAFRNPERELIWPWPRHLSRLYHIYGDILKRAGLPDDRRHKFHAMRITVLSMVKAAGGDPTVAAKHSNPSTTHKHYMDPRLTGEKSPWEIIGAHNAAPASEVPLLPPPRVASQEPPHPSPEDPDWAAWV